MKRTAKILVFTLVLLAAAAGTWRWLRMEEGGAPERTTLYGNIDIRSVRLAFSESERIARVMVEEGDRVEAGEALATLHSDRLRARIRQVDAEIAVQRQVLDKLVAGTRPQEIAQARAELEAARVKVANASQSLERIRKTADSGATSRQALDDATARLDVEQAALRVRDKALSLALEGPRREDVAAARSRLEMSNASRELLGVRLAEMTLRSPSAGIVQSRLLEPGAMAGPESPVFTLALTNPKWARVYVGEPDLGRVRLGMPAAIHSDSFPGRRFEGWVGFISPEAEFTPKTVETTELRTQLVYEARIFVHDPGDLLRLGMPVTVTVDRETAAGMDARPENAARENAAPANPGVKDAP